MANSIENSVAKQTIAIPCPKCGTETKQTVAWLKNNKEFVCSGCGVTIAPDATELFRQLASADKTLKDTIRRFGK
ncbi:hypothetical protein AB7783_12325 [Tardiphaga sp. 172_B4_N1_3]|uniref:hypothetical protein n=1 Tax=Tardiphaga sp. 172_B4_N1_3 TaxID=3240787 RepID=UPI003F89DA2A